MDMKIPHPKTSAASPLTNRGNRYLKHCPIKNWAKVVFYYIHRPSDRSKTSVPMYCIFKNAIKYDQSRWII